MSDVNCELKQLMQDVMEAARYGQWDRVIALYDLRLAQGTPPSLSSESIQSLMESDQWLINRVREAQAAIKQHLYAIQNERRKLAVVKRQWGENQTTPVRHLLTI